MEDLQKKLESLKNSELFEGLTAQKAEMVIGGLSSVYQGLFKPFPIGIPNPIDWKVVIGNPQIPQGFPNGIPGNIGQLRQF